jgi:hypothetical protein
MKIETLKLSDGTEVHLKHYSDTINMYQCDTCNVWVVQEHIQGGTCLECCL